MLLDNNDFISKMFKMYQTENPSTITLTIKRCIFKYIKI